MKKARFVFRAFVPSEITFQVFCLSLRVQPVLLLPPPTLLWRFGSCTMPRAVRAAYALASYPHSPLSLLLLYDTGDDGDGKTGSKFGHLHVVFRDWNYSGTAEDVSPHVIEFLCWRRLSYPFLRWGGRQRTT